jgi:SSS family solute:Na+ symporter
MAFEVSTTAAYVVLFVVLGVFTLLAFGSAGLFWFLPDAITRCCILGEKSEGADYFLAARNSASAWTIALSFFASGMGAWVLYGSTEMGATPQLSWIAVIGYSGASALPAIVIGWWLGPMVRDMTDETAFCTSDFGRQRYGRVMQVVISLVSLFYMFIYLVAELTAVSNVFATLTNNWDKTFGIIVTVALGLITIFYTTIAGLPASIVTDKFQGIIMAVLVIMLLIAVTAEPTNRVTPEEFALASNWTTEGLMAAVTLIIAIMSAELFNQSTWQRVWAAESVPAMRKGFMIGSLLVFLLMMFFGIMAMLAYAL